MSDELIRRQAEVDAQRLGERDDFEPDPNEPVIPWRQPETPVASRAQRLRALERGYGGELPEKLRRSVLGPEPVVEESSGLDADAG